MSSPGGGGREGGPAAPDTPSRIREVLARRGIRPRKRLGQHFLADPNLRDAIVAAAGPGEEDLVLEVGAGLGALTAGLLASGAEVVASEIDGGLLAFLEERFAGEVRLTLVGGDALHRGGLAPALGRALGRRRAAARRLLFVSNLPYSAGTPLLAALARDEDPPERWVVMVQREVARRMAGRPGSADYGPLAVLLALRGEVRILREVTGRVFVPRTEVRSALVEFVPRPGDRGDLLAGDRAARAAFLHRRKSLRRALEAAGQPAALVAEVLSDLGIDPGARPEVLAPRDFASIGRKLAAAAGSSAP